MSLMIFTAERIKKTKFYMQHNVIACAAQLMICIFAIGTVDKGQFHAVCELQSTKIAFAVDKWLR